MDNVGWWAEHSNLNAMVGRQIRSLTGRATGIRHKTIIMKNKTSQRSRKCSCRGVEETILKHAAECMTLARSLTSTDESTHGCSYILKDPWIVILRGEFMKRELGLEAAVLNNATKEAILRKVVVFALLKEDGSRVELVVSHGLSKERCRSGIVDMIRVGLCLRVPPKEGKVVLDRSKVVQISFGELVLARRGSYRTGGVA